MTHLINLTRCRGAFAPKNIASGHYVPSPMQERTSRGPCQKGLNLTHSNIRSLEQTDEQFLSRILESETNTSNDMKYIEGVYPVRFELMKRKIVFLQYILKQDKYSMIYQVLKATIEKTIKNDFVKTCEEYYFGYQTISQRN